MSIESTGRTADRDARQFGWSYDVNVYPRQPSDAHHVADLLGREIGFVPARENSKEGDALLREGERVRCRLWASDDEGGMAELAFAQSALEVAAGCPLIVTGEQEALWRMPVDAWLSAAIVRVHLTIPIRAAVLGPEATGDVALGDILAQGVSLREWAGLLVPAAEGSSDLVWLPPLSHAR